MTHEDVCKFCNKSDINAVLLTSEFDDNVCICTNCAIACTKYHPTKESSSENKNKKSKDFVESIDLSTPSEIKKHLDHFIIGQEDAKIAIATGVYNHYKKIKYKFSEKEENCINLEKTNIMLLGPTGCGKTKMIKLISKLLNVPFSIADATSITESGYAGNDVESMLLPLLSSKDIHNKSFERAELGIVYIDEIDKIRRSSNNISISKDVSGQGVQHSLLKMIEGTNVILPTEDGRKHPDDVHTTINTENILFIVGGAFDGIEKIVEKRKSVSMIGFSSMQKEQKTFSHWESINEQDVIDFGMMKEFVGRFGNIAKFRKLSVEDLKRIAVEPYDSVVRQFKKLFSLHDIDLEFTECAIEAIAKKSEKMNIGARALRHIIEKILTKSMFTAPDGNIEKIIITGQTIENEKEPDLIKNKTISVVS